MLCSLTCLSNLLLKLKKYLLLLGQKRTPDSYCVWSG